MQQSIEQAHEQGYLELSKWAENIIKRIRMSYEVQHIWTGDGNSEGPYPGYIYVNAARHGAYKSTGASYKGLHKFVINAAGGDTVAVDFFFKRYLLFVDWGVGAGQRKEAVPRKGGDIKMTSRYAKWDFTGDRQRRPVIFGGIRGGMFGMLRILKSYWGKETELAVLAGLGLVKDGKYIEKYGNIHGGQAITLE